MIFTQICKRGFSSFAFVTMAALLGAVSYQVAYAASSDTKLSTPAQAEEFQVGSLYVEKYANSRAHGAPLILIPGLSSGAYVWDETVKQLRDNHELYVVTLAGFNGKPTQAGSKLPKLKASLLELIQTQKIDRPVLVGHSLGSASSIWFAESHSDLIRGVFAVDGLPVFPGTQNLNEEQRTTMAESSRQQMASADAKVFAQQQLQYMRFMGVINPQLAEQIAVRSATSDPVATADYMAELLMLDMRKDLSKIQVPVTVISPYYASDFARANMSEEAKSNLYKSLVQGIPNVNVISIPEARHFVMLDQAQVFHAKLREFLAQL